MSIIIILAALALALVMFIAYIASRLVMADSAQFEADSESEPHVLPTLTSSMDARIFSRNVQTFKAIVPPSQTMEIGISEADRLRAIRQTELNRIALRATIGVDRPTDRLEAVTPNRRAVIASLNTIVLDQPDEIAPLTPNQALALAPTEWARDTQVDPSPYGQGRCPKTGRKRGANGRWIAE